MKGWRENIQPSQVGNLKYISQKIDIDIVMEGNEFFDCTVYPEKVENKANK